MSRSSMTNFAEHPLWISKSQAFLLLNHPDFRGTRSNISPRDRFSYRGKQANFPVDLSPHSGSGHGGLGIRRYARHYGKR